MNARRQTTSHIVSRHNSKYLGPSMVVEPDWPGRRAADCALVGWHALDKIAPRG